MEKKELEALKKLPFEKALEQLEQIVSKMEAGELALDELMQVYEKGQVLAAVCGDKLKSIEKKVEILRKRASGDEWEEFDPADGEQAGSATRSAQDTLEEDDTAEKGETPGDLPF